MAESTPWDALYEQYLNALPDWNIHPIPAVRSDALTVSQAAVLGNPTKEDIDWLTRALALPQQKWFVVGFLEAATSIAEALFCPIMAAAIDEVNPSLNRNFVEPCVRAFGGRRVIEHLLDVLETGADSQKAGAVNALYWAHVPFEFSGDPSEFSYARAWMDTHAYEEFCRLQQRERTLCLKTFVTNKDLHVRRSLIAHLNLDEASYEPADRPLVSQAIGIARSHSDPYIRQRLAVQLGESHLFPALPDRDE